MKLILASASPRRKELLEQIGIKPVVIPSKLAESIQKAVPWEVVEELSLQKCMDVALHVNDTAWVLGADTVVVYQERILGKPKDEEEACQMLNLLQGNTHQVYTGVTLAKVEQGSILKVKTFSEKTDVILYSMTEEEIKSYVETKDPMDKAGAYGIQGIFAKYIKGITGDYNNVVGLPVAAVYQWLSAHDTL